jgi:Tfp pilus assembly protein PilV
MSPKFFKKIKNNKKGFLLIEVLLSISIFVIVVLAYSGALIYGQENINLAGARSRAVFLAEEGLEVVKNMRDNDFVNLTDGTYGLTVAGSNWIFSGANDVIDIFTREIEILTVDSNTKQVTSNITWPQNLQRQGNISLVTYLTNWQDIVSAGLQADYLVVDTISADVNPGDNTEAIGVTLENIGTTDITIDRMIISWSGGGNNNHLRGITIDGASVWSGNVNPGADIDITDALLITGSGTISLDLLDFQKDITGATLNITFVMSDASTKQENFTLGAGGGVPTGDAANLAVDITGVLINVSDNTEVMGITLENIGATDIAIDQLIISWSGGPNGNHLRGIIIGGASVWSGNTNSGSSVDITDVLLATGSDITALNLLDFQKDMNGVTINIIFVMSDTTTRVINGINL